MEITIVTQKWERDEYRKVVDAYGQVSDDRMTKEEYDKLPRKVWVDLVDDGGGVINPPFTVIDNTTGHCWVEDFETLDGAILYASGVKDGPDEESDWDYMGALKDGGDLTEREEAK